MLSATGIWLTHAICAGALDAMSRAENYRERGESTPVGFWSRDLCKVVEFQKKSLREAAARPSHGDTVEPQTASREDGEGREVAKKTMLQAVLRVAQFAGTLR